MLLFYGYIHKFFPVTTTFAPSIKISAYISTSFFIGYRTTHAQTIVFHPLPTNKRKPTAPRAGTKVKLKPR